MKGQMILRPGWIRINFNYFISEESFDYILAAVELVAEHGWRLLPYYQFDTGSGTWRFQNSSTHYMANLDDFTLGKPDHTNKDKKINDQDLQSFLIQAKQTLLGEKKGLIRSELSISQSADRHRWFTLPQEVAQL